MASILNRTMIRRDLLVGGVGTLWALFQIYSTLNGPYIIQIQNTIHLGFGLCIAYLVFPFFRKTSLTKSPRNGVPLWDLLLAVLAMASNIYLFLNADRLSSRVLFVDNVFTLDKVSGTIIIILLIEATRRAVGWPLAGLAIVAVAYSFFGYLLPGLAHTSKNSVNKFIEYQVLSSAGVFGTPTSVSATFAYMFILFGTFLASTGAGRFFIDSALALTGRSAGGPAKAAIVGSGLIGMVSGSAIANVMTVGVFTIPLMKKTGYSATFAGGVETAASSGGQIMPPVMGVAAFIMAELTGISYWSICIAAAIPALLYYLNMYLMVHLEAVENGLTGLPADQLPPKKSLFKGLFLLTPLVVMVVCLANGFTPLRSGFVAAASTLVIAPFSAQNIAIIGSRNLIFMLKSALRGIYHAFLASAKPAVIVAVTCATAGIVVGSLTLTGITLRVSASAMGLTGSSLLIGLFVLAIVSLLLGMGIPTSAAYITVAAAIVPSLVWMGLPKISAHMFALWATSMAAITPPVALAAYAAAPLAGAPLWDTCVQGVKLGVMMLILPFMFVYHPALLAQGEPLEIALTALLAVVATTMVATSMEGRFFGRMSIVERFLCLVAGLLMFNPMWQLFMGGLGLGVILIAKNWFGARSARAVIRNG